MTDLDLVSESEYVPRDFECRRTHRSFTSGQTTGGTCSVREGHERGLERSGPLRVVPTGPVLASGGTVGRGVDRPLEDLAEESQSCPWG